MLLDIDIRVLGLLIDAHTPTCIAHAQAEEAACDGNRGAAPPRQTAVADFHAGREEEAGDGRTEGAGERGGRGCNAVDGAEHEEGGRGVSEKDGVGGVGHG